MSDGPHKNDLRVALEQSLLLSQVALEAIRVVHPSGDTKSRGETCGECGNGGCGDLRDALTKALGAGYTGLVWGADLNVSRRAWNAALYNAAQDSLARRDAPSSAADAPTPTVAPDDLKQHQHRRRLARIYEDVISAAQNETLLMSEVLVRARDALYEAGFSDGAALPTRPRFGIGPTCDQCGQGMSHRDAVSVAYFVENSGEPRRIAVPGSFHSGDCADQALVMFGRAFRMGQLTSPTNGKLQTTAEERRK